MYFFLSFCFFLFGCSREAAPVKISSDIVISENSENHELSFRDIPLGTNYKEAKEGLIQNLKSEGYKCDIKERVFDKIVTIDDYEYITVAGHQATWAATFCMPDRSNIQQKNLKQTILQNGTYTFYPSYEELDNVYYEIRDKLIGLYGRPAEVSADGSKICKWNSLSGNSSIWVSALISRLQDMPKRRDQGKFFGQVKV